MTAESPLALCIARFSVPDEAAVESVRAALAHGSRCIVVLRDAFMARSARCPFTWDERADMLKAALAPEDAARLAAAQFVPLRERYDEDRTVDDLQGLVESTCPPDAAATDVTLYFCGERDPRLESAVTRRKPWKLADTRTCTDPRQLQDQLFAADNESGIAESLRGLLPQAVADALPSWLARLDYASLRAEHQQLRRDHQIWACVPYPVTLVTVDAVLRARDHVLLIRRGRPPGKGLRALPGGFLEPGDTVYDSAVRELQEETRIALTADEARNLLRGVQVFDHPRRSQRGNRVITHAHYFDLGDIEPPKVEGGDDAAAAEWVPLHELGAMEAEFLDDHFEILLRFVGEDISAPG
jgi:bifunctional NMN adenylyltransferase/nudix hydrolase